jgi:hypothetical protein
VHQLAFLSLSASLPNAYEVVHDYMEVATYLHLSQSSLVQLLLAGSRRTLVANTSINSSSNALSFVLSCGDPSKVI